MFIQMTSSKLTKIFIYVVISIIIPQNGFSSNTVKPRLSPNERFASKYISGNHECQKIEEFYCSSSSKCKVNSNTKAVTRKTYKCVGSFNKTANASQCQKKKDVHYLTSLCHDKGNGRFRKCSKAEEKTERINPKTDSNKCNGCSWKTSRRTPYCQKIVKSNAQLAQEEKDAILRSNRIQQKEAQQKAQQLKQAEANKYKDVNDPYVKKYLEIENRAKNNKDDFSMTEDERQMWLEGGARYKAQQNKQKLDEFHKSGPKSGKLNTKYGLIDQEQQRANSARTTAQTAAQAKAGHAADARNRAQQQAAANQWGEQQAQANRAAVARQEQQYDQARAKTQRTVDSQNQARQAAVKQQQAQQRANSARTTAQTAAQAKAGHEADARNRAQQQAAANRWGEQQAQANRAAVARQQQQYDQARAKTQRTVDSQNQARQAAVKQQQAQQRANSARTTAQTAAQAKAGHEADARNRAQQQAAANRWGEQQVASLNAAREENRTAQQQARDKQQSEIDSQVNRQRAERFISKAIGICERMLRDKNSPDMSLASVYKTHYNNAVKFDRNIVNFSGKIKDKGPISDKVKECNNAINFNPK